MLIRAADGAAVAAPVDVGTTTVVVAVDVVAAAAAAVCVAATAAVVGADRIAADAVAPSGVLQSKQQEAALDDLYAESLRMVDNSHKLALKVIDKVCVSATVLFSLARRVWVLIRFSFFVSTTPRHCCLPRVSCPFFRHSQPAGQER